MMKKALPLVLVLGLLIGLHLVNTGAQIASDEPTGTPEQRGPNERFYTLSEKLDPGGSLYLYVDLKDVLRDWMKEMTTVLADSGLPPQAIIGYVLADQALEILGLYGIEDLGVSVVKMEGYNRSKTYIRSPGEKTGILRILGGEPHEFDTLAYAPPDTVLFRHFDLDPTEALNLVRSMYKSISGEVGVAKFDENLAKLGSNCGMDIKEVLSSLLGHFTLIASFDPVEKLTISPDRPDAVEVPAPRFALLMKTSDATLFEGVKAALVKKEQPAEEWLERGFRRLPLPGSGGEVYELNPVLAHGNGLTIFASHPGYLDTVLATKDKDENLAHQEEFQTMTEGLPRRGNGMTFVSRRLSEEIQSLLKQLRASAAAEGAKDLGPLGLLPMAKEPSGMAFVRVNEPDGVWIVANSPMGGAQTLVMTGGGPMAALMAAIALPNFFEAKTRSKVARTKSELRNLAVCLETYYIDYNAYPAAVDENGELVPLKENGEGVSAGYVPWALTTPIAYTTSLPADPNHKKDDGTNALYRYATNGAECWILAGHGPDRDADVEVADYPSPNRGQCQWRSFASQFGVGDAIEYDSTNGTTSSGDILRVGP